MLKKMVAFVARHAGKERSIKVRILSLVLGIFAFFIVAPIVLGMGGHFIAKHVNLAIPRIVEVPTGIAGICVGLFFLLWAVSAFWFIGKGTPVPFASPTRLVTCGPFKYTRNPIKLGAILFYFGVGTICDQIATGLIMLTIGAILGTIYHKTIEEKELRFRFGHEYEQYRERTSFFIPWPPKNKNVA